jgi:hypothetical protein
MVTGRGYRTAFRSRSTSKCATPRRRVIAEGADAMPGSRICHQDSRRLRPSLYLDGLIFAIRLITTVIAEHGSIPASSPLPRATSGAARRSYRPRPEP